VLLLCLYKLNEGVLAEGTTFFFDRALSLASVTPIDVHYDHTERNVVSDICNYYY
jgi:hypothetical protein